MSAVRPEIKTVLGRQVTDYSLTRASPAPRLVPLEVVFRFSAPAGSSLYERVERDPGYLAALGADVAKALRKAGHPKPKRERPAPVALSGQADLLAEAAEPAPAVLPSASTGV